MRLERKQEAQDLIKNRVNESKATFLQHTAYSPTALSPRSSSAQSPRSPSALSPRSPLSPSVTNNGFNFKAAPPVTVEPVQTKVEEVAPPSPVAEPEPEPEPEPAKTQKDNVGINHLLFLLWFINKIFL